jgi:phospholipid/cholesterol/gamma-HCH transport system permease protein
VVFREYSLPHASVLVAAQAGSSIAARIGTMKVRGQIDALAVMSVDPLRYVAESAEDAELLYYLVPSRMK